MHRKSLVVVIVQGKVSTDPWPLRKADWMRLRLLTIDHISGGCLSCNLQMDSLPRRSYLLWDTHKYQWRRIRVLTLSMEYVRFHFHQLKLMTMGIRKDRQQFLNKHIATRLLLSSYVIGLYRYVWVKGQRSSWWLKDNANSQHSPIRYNIILVKGTEFRKILWETYPDYGCSVKNIFLGMTLKNLKKRLKPTKNRTIALQR